MNQINTRREFFCATPDEPKEALNQIHGIILDYREEPEEEQFRASFALPGVKSE